jgi:hypothetical protein
MMYTIPGVSTLNMTISFMVEIVIRETLGAIHVNFRSIYAVSVFESRLAISAAALAWKLPLMLNKELLPALLAGRVFPARQIWPSGGIVYDKEWGGAYLCYRLSL